MSDGRMKAVRYVGKGSGLPPEYLESLNPESGYAIVDSLPGGNVTIRAELDGSAVEFQPDKLTRDFLDIATLVYVVDEVLLREDAPDYWTRSFEVMAPVENPVLWAANEDALSQMLRTLAGDNYSFTWCKRAALPNFGRHRTHLPRGYDTVCLFSGGIDSFLGAHNLLSEGKKLLLIGHQADGTAASAQTELAEVLRNRFPGKLRLIQFRGARSMIKEPRFALPEKVEETHRPRSLLFLALAVTIAKCVGITTVYIPENGLIALNPPLGKSRLGTLSTRTAHPKYLTELGDFLSATGIFNGHIKNPFLFQSKTDMLKNLDSSLHAVMRRTVSCARPSRYKNLHVRHCGYCVPCIYRRIAMAGASMDSAGEYAYDVFRNLSAVDQNKQLDFRSLVSFAKAYLNKSRTGKELVVMAHGTFPLNSGERFGDETVDSYSPWSVMIERWATDFLAKLRAVTTADTRRIIGL